MAKISIEYIDSSGLSEQEITAQMRHIFGESAYIATAPDNNAAKTCIKYAIQKLVIDKQVVSFFDDPKRIYEMHKRDLRVDILELVTEIFDNVITENETKWI